MQAASNNEALTRYGKTQEALLGPILDRELALAKEAAQKLSSAFQEGQDAFLMGQAMNPYRRALRAVSIPAERKALWEFAQEWDNGFCSTKR